MNVVEYVEKYGDYSFKEKVFNEIDNLVFSELVYLNFDESDNTIENIGKNYLKKNRYKNIKKLGPAQDTAYRVLEKAINKKRYKDIVMKDYVFKHNINCQFSAATFIIDNNLNYIAFEGTDELISGWKEDFLMASYFPIPSHIEAHDYLDKHIKLIGPDIIVGGHSKGGNLALVGSMYLKLSKQVKIRKIYSKYILRMVIAFLTWSIFYALMTPEYFENGMLYGIKTHIDAMVSGHYHMWFVLMIIGIYMCIPF